MSELVLFICTGNYYRSRFAEAIFNHHAIRRGLTWRAFSRGLAIHEVEGDLSAFTFHGLMDRGIDLHLTSPNRVSLSADDLGKAAHIVALKQTEHLAKMQDQFPFWANKITYWEVHDLDVAGPEETLPVIEQKVLALLDSLTIPAPLA